MAIPAELGDSAGPDTPTSPYVAIEGIEQSAVDPGGDAGGSAAGAMEDSRNDTHTRIACASTACRSLWRCEKG
jgi:hypothetical protein